MTDSLLSTPAQVPAATAAPVAAPATPAADPANPAPAQAPAAGMPASFIGDGGSLHFQHAAGYLPKELHGAIDGFQARFEGKTVADVLKSYNELEGQYSQIKGARAVPEKATLEAYGISKPKDLADDAWKADAPKIEKFVQIAHEAGMGKEEFGKLYNAYAESLVADHQAAAAADKAAKTAAYNHLVDAWGAEFEPRRETAFNKAQEILTTLGINVDESADAIALYNNPVFIRIMHHQAKSLGESSTTLPPGAATVASLSDAEKAMDIMTNPQNPQHAKFIEESKMGGGPTVDYVQKLRSKVTRPRGT